VVALGFGNSILPNFVEQSFVADLQDPGCLFAIPIGLFERLPDGFSLGFVLGAASQGFQSATRVPAFHARLSACAASVAVMKGLQFRGCEVLIPEDQVTLQEIIQFPQIARPRIPLACLQQCWREWKLGPRVLFRHVGHEVLEQDGYFFFAIPQWR
jgi:hypothetical protein